MIEDCTTCHFAAWPEHPSGRRIFHRGTCAVAVLIPRAYVDLRGDMPRRGDISKYTCQRATCMCYKKMTAKARRKLIA